MINEIVNRVTPPPSAKERRGFNTHESRKIPRRPEQKYAPLSLAQQRLWFVNQLEPGNAIYNIPSALQLDGSLDVLALQRTLNEVVRRHEVLRTRFVMIAGEPRQEVLEPAVMDLLITDLSGLDRSAREAAVREAVRVESRKPFDLEQGPLLRVKLLRLSEQEHVVVLTLHHIVSDDWSMGVLLREVSALYAAYSEGRESMLPELPIQYADFAVWQRGRLHGEELERQLHYWGKQLGGELPALELPADYTRPAVPTHKGSRRQLQLSPELTAQLRELSRQHGATLFMTLMAAFQTLLYRYTGQKKIVIGIPVAGRNHTSVESLIGFFINQLALCFDLSGDPTFNEIVQRTRQVCLDAFAHQDIPFDRLVEEFYRHNEFNSSPFFQVGLVLHNTRRTSVQMSGLVGRSIELETDVAKVDLMMDVVESEDRLNITLVYSTELFEAARIERMLQHFEVLLQGIGKNAEQRLWQLPLLGEAEWRETVREWNETRRDHGPLVPVHQLFEAQAEQRPEAVALVCGNKQLTYDELNRRANQLAHYLRKQGVGAEVVVGLCLERSPEMLVALLGIMKAGGAYLPLDPEYPQQRLEYIVADAQVGLVLTEERLLEQLPVHWGRTIVLDQEWKAIAEESAVNLEPVSEAENLAYVIYTSGSTGQPKGVMVTHGGLRNLAAAQIECFGIRPNSRVLQFASLNFDASIFEICMALCQGAQLHLAGSEQVLVGATLGELVEQQEISVVTLPPSVLKQLRGGEEFAKLEMLIVAGEACGEELVEQWSEKRHFFNAYGPTEATVWSTLAECDRGEGRPAIGRAISNVEVYVLDEWQQPVAIGVRGEIYIGGAGVARGYWERAELTAERFVPHPYSERGGERLYRTGDEGRYLEDGRIDYLGRRDQQVKLRGYRIELGEIEAVLESHAAVEQAIVIVREDSAGDQRLVGYVVGQGLGNEREVTAELRGYLKERLPEYMVPQQWVLLEQLPLTANGKVDRQALPAPSSGAVLLDQEEERERTPVEELVAGIWSEVLKVATVGREANFFELGGHSLLATQVISRVREVFGVEVELRRLFAEPVLKGFSRTIENELRAGAGMTAPPLTPAEREQWNGLLPLSFAQQRLWFMDQLEPENTAYNVPAAVRFRGELDVAALEQVLSEIVRRHEVLRTCFVSVDGEPRQELLEAVEVKLPITDLNELEEAEREAAVNEAATAEGREPFDLAHGPLLRVKLLRLRDQEHVVLLTMHHIVSDGWSMGILIKEVATLYDAYSNGKVSPLPDLPIQYGDFAVWQRSWLQGEELERQMGYWREQLSGELPVLELASDHSRPAVHSPGGARLTFRLTPEVSAGLKELSRREGVTLFMTLLAAFQTLLSRYSGLKEILVGSPVAGRNYQGTEPLAGCFVNTLVLRTKLSGAPTFLELLERVKDVCLGAYAHQDVPFEKLVEELQPERDLNRAPLFQTMFVFQNAPRQELQLSGIQLSRAAGEHVTAKFDLTLVLEDEGEELRGALEYKTELFEPARIERMLRHFEVLLQGIVTNPEQRVWELPLLNEAERETIRGWNEARRDYGPMVPMHELFEAQVVQRPEAVALVCGDEQLSYCELNRRANQLAHYLRKQGVGAEVVVGLCLERSMEMVVALLGILKAGGAYLPLDPEYPEQRLEYMLADTQVKLVLTEQRLSGHLTFQGRTIALDQDQEREAISSESTANPEPVSEAGNLAYVIYTSGSTGQPKGAMLTHRGLCNLAGVQIEYFGVSANSRVLQYASLNFDGSIFEVCMALYHGGQLHLPGSEQVLVGGALTELLWRQEISLVVLPPSVLKQLRNDERFAKLETLVVAGEACTEELVEEWSKGRRFINGYGPTEATICTASTECHPGEGRPPIGRPFGNVEVYVLDEWLGVVPVGVRGEIYVGGAGLARGYWARAELTAGRFVPHPYSKSGGERLYRTGDEGRYLDDGRLEYLGRRDQQVKLRGYRIELGEIEAVLESHARVQQAVVMIAEASGGVERLVGYVVPEGAGEQEVTTELRGYLHERLPEYMVPQQWVVLEQLPLTASGKVNRQALPAPSLTPRVLDHNDGGEWTPVEELLAGTWSEVLKVAAVGRDENFFELGGHSLLATQVISRVRKVFGVEVELRRLFEEPTVRGLSRSIEKELRAGAEVTAPPLVRAEREQLEGLPLSFAQQRLWFLDQLEPGSGFYNMPTAVRLRGQLDVAALEKTLTEIVRRHEVLRTRFVRIGGEARQEILEAAEVKLAVIDFSELEEPAREAAVREAVAAESSKPFDLAHGPLLRVMLLHLSGEEQMVLLTMHHIVGDGWSMSVLIREVATLYEAYIKGENSPLRELPVQYVDFAVWQRGWLQGEALERQMSYWRKQLGGDLPVLNLPADRRRPLTQSYDGTRLSFRVTPGVRSGLKELSRREGVTLFMTLLAAFQTLLARYSGQDEVVVGTDVANRNYAETESLIGFFVNQLVLRTDMGGELTFVELLQRVKEVCLEAYAHQDVPFEKLVDELQPERDLSRSPLFQVKLVLQNTPRQDLRMPGLQLSQTAVEHVTAKFDLTLLLEDEGEELHGALEYKTELFEPARIERMLRHFEVLLQGIVTNPEQRLWELPLLDKAEQETIRGWNETRRDYGPVVPMHELFEAQVVQRPEAVALVCGDEQLSYRELNRRANQLAHYLRKQGVGAEVVVGLCLERSVEMVVALLGILKAGGAYLPLDPEYPEQQETQVKLVLTGHELTLQGHTIALDEERATIALESDVNPAVVVEPGNLASVIYTSGSTGAMLTHGALCNLAGMQRECFGVSADSRVLQFASLDSHASIFEICLALCHGGELHLSGSEQVLVGPALLELLHEQGINAALLPPSMLKQMGDGADLDKLEILIASGEACGEELVEKWSEGRRFFNGYGLAEATVCATSTECHRGEGQPPIGPAGNMEVYVLDEWLGVVPVGVRGEIYVGGAGLARGYWARAELTAERFVPHPYSKSGGERLYRTGDEGRYLDDGRLEYLGRRDQQVKLGGYRVDLGEVEAVLESHPRVQQAVVMAREEVEGDKWLVGYVVPEGADGEQEITAELRGYLRERLPEYMAPRQWMVLEQLPVSANGKVDRQALPAPGKKNIDQSSEEPFTPVEKILAEIWRSVLSVEHVGKNDNFFELGGDSIVSILIVAKAQELGIQLTPRDLFRHKTIAELAAVAGSVNPVAAEQETVTGNLPLTPIQRWFFERELSNIRHFNQSVMLEAPPSFSLTALKYSIEKLLDHHDALRMRFPDTQPRINSHIVAAETNDVLWEVDVSHYDEYLRTKELEIIAGDAQASLNLSDGPLVRFVFFNFGPYESGRLLIVIHHLVVDGVSWRVLVEDLRKTYQQAVAGEPLNLPPKTTSVKRWAESLQQYAQSEELATELSHWIAISKEQVPSLPVDSSNHPERPPERASAVNSLTAEETRALLQDVPRAHHTQINDVLIAALAHTLSVWSGNTTLLLNLEGHGREVTDPAIDLSRTVGWFTTLHPVLLKIRPGQSWEDLLSYAGNELRRTPNKGLGYGVLKYLADEEISTRLRNGSEAEVCFNYLGQFHQQPGEDTLFSFASESTGQASSKWQKREYLLDISTVVAGDRLTTQWAYDKNVHRLETIEELAAQYLEALRQIIMRSQSPTAVAVTR